MSVFHLDWLGSDLRIGHLFGFRCLLVNAPQLNSQSWLQSDCPLFQLTEWLLARSSQHGSLYSLLVTVENVCCVAVVTGMCLPNHCLAVDYFASLCCCGNVSLASRWLAVDFGSGSTVPAFGHPCVVDSVTSESCLLSRCLAVVICVTIHTTTYFDQFDHFQVVYINVWYTIINMDPY
jgi:hypothetical protein